MDQDLSFVQDNLAGPLDKLLAFANGLLDGSTSEALSVASVTATGAVSAGSVAATGAITGATVAVTGAISGASLTVTGAVSANTVAATTSVTSATVTGSTSVVSGSGFKCLVGGIQYYSSNYTPANTSVRLTFTLFNSATSAVTQVEGRVPMPFAGSIVGLGVMYFGSAVGTPNVTCTIGKNGSTVQTETNILVAPATFATAIKTYTKGSLAFAANDYLTVNTSFSATGDRGISAVLVVEYGA